MHDLPWDIAQHRNITATAQFLPISHLAYKCSASRTCQSSSSHSPRSAVYTYGTSQGHTLQYVNLHLLCALSGQTCYSLVSYSKGTIQWIFANLLPSAFSGNVKVLLYIIIRVVCANMKIGKLAIAVAFATKNKTHLPANCRSNRLKITNKLTDSMYVSWQVTYNIWSPSLLKYS